MTNKRKRNRSARTLVGATLTVAVCLSLTACASETDDTPLPRSTSDDNNNTMQPYEHPESMAEETAEPLLTGDAPNSFLSRVHGCRKVRYRTVQRFLASRGIDFAAEVPSPIVEIFRASDQTLGAPNYLGRQREASELTTSSAARLFDIFVQAAPDIIGAISTIDACKVGSVGATLFSGDGECQESGLTCLMGVPATPEHLAVCNDIVNRAESVEEGQRLAVASLLAATFTCE